MSGRYRWIVEYELPGGSFKDLIRLKDRPSLKAEEKGKWEAIAITHVDCGENTMVPLYEYFHKCWSYIEQGKEELPDELKITINLELLVPERCPSCLSIIHSDMKPIEGWILKKAFPTSINFGDLDYSSSSQIDIEITWKYEETEYKNYYKPLPVEPSPIASQFTSPPMGLGTLGLCEHHPQCRNASKSGHIQNASVHLPDTRHDQPGEDTQQPPPNPQRNTHQEPVQGSHQNTKEDSTQTPSSNVGASVASYRSPGLFRGGFLRWARHMVGWR